MKGLHASNLQLRPRSLAASGAAEQPKPNDVGLEAALARDGPWVG